jgi:hypothetical protein
LQVISEMFMNKTVFGEFSCTCDFNAWTSDLFEIVHGLEESIELIGIKLVGSTPRVSVNWLNSFEPERSFEQQPQEKLGYESC